MVEDTTLDESSLANELDHRGEEQLYRALRRFWHPVAYAADVVDRPVPATLLDEQLVLVRLAGSIRCFKDLCVHRGTALSLGAIEGDELRCAYHGWTYGPDGACTKIPARFGANIPSRARLTGFRCEQRDGLVWVCLDEPHYPLPTFAEFSREDFHIATVPAYDWNCSATRRVENYVDFAHFAWLHDGILASREHPEVPEHPVWREGPELRFEGVRTEPESSSKPAIDGEAAPVHSRTEYRLFMPFSIWLHQIYDDAREFSLFMAASPVGRKKVRSFTFNARNYDLGGDDAPYIEFQELIVSQDLPIAESQRPEELPMDLSAELHIRGVDKVSIEYRKWLVELKALAAE